MSILLTVVWGIVVLGILVLVHELGHFVAARAFGVRVTEFMFGMPGPNVGFEHNGCRYGITCIPLGGYNRIAGMEGGDEDPNLARVLAYVYRQGHVDVEHTALACGISEEDAAFALEVLDGWGSVNKPGRGNKTQDWCAPQTAGHALGEAREVPDPRALLDAERTHTYRGLPFWKREVVLFAGPVMNLLLTVVVFLVMFCGMGVEYGTTTIDSVVEDGPAVEAGLEPGDTVTAVNGTPVESVSELSMALSGCAVGDEVQVTYERAGEQRETVVTVAQGEGGNPIIGIYAASGRYRLGVVDALAFSGELLVMTVQSYASLFNPATAAETVGQSSSIVGISVMAKQAADAGLFNVLFLIAVISLSLGVVNLLPVPPLDGGKIVTEVIQRVTRRNIPARVINATSFAMIALFLVLFVALTQQDITRFILTP